MSNYRQLILFDCDGGRGTLFYDKTILNQLPSNCECYLFWNKDSQVVTNKLIQLTDNPQIHLCASHLKNSKNSADGKLIYFLGKFVERFDFIYIVHGNDNIYHEIVETVIHEYNHQKIDQKKIQNPKSQTLKDIFMQLRKRNEQHNYVDPKLQLLLNSPCISESANITNSICPNCPKRFKDISALRSHIKAKHNQNGLFTCACSSKFDTMKKFNSHRKEIKRQIIDKQGVIRCRRTQESPKVYLTKDSTPIVLLPGKNNQCSLKCGHRRYFEPSGLFTHLEAKHPSTINIHVQCCNPNITYKLNEYGDHIHSQHVLVNI